MIDREILAAQLATRMQFIVELAKFCKLIRERRWPAAPVFLGNKRVPSDSVNYHPAPYVKDYYWRTVERRRERARYFAWRRRAREMGLDV